MISLQHYLALAAVLFIIGAAGVAVRGQAFFILMSVMLMFAAANIAILGFARWTLLSEGCAIAVLLIAVEAALVVAGLCIIRTKRRGTRIQGPGN